MPHERGKGHSGSLLSGDLSFWLCSLLFVGMNQSHEVRFTTGDLGNKSEGHVPLREEGIQVKGEQLSFSGLSQEFLD